MVRKVGAFISFAAEDSWARDLFVGQSRQPDTPWEIADWSLHEPFSQKWKTQTRERIRKTDLAIMLVGQDTHRAEGAIWEAECGFEEGKKAFGVHISRSERGPIPQCFSSNNVIEWTWDGVASMIKKAAS